MQIFHAFGAVVSRLGGCVTDPLEDQPRWNACRGRDQFCDKGGLVEAALAFARRMQRHRHDQIEVTAAQPWVVKTFGEPSRHRITEMALLPVFELVENFADEAAA